MANSVYVSPSTQERNLYAGGLGTEEEWMNKLADKLIPKLNYNGFVTFRNKPEMHLSDIIHDSDSKKPDVHVALHSNAGGGHGCTVYVYLIKGTITNSQRLGQDIYNEVSAVTTPSDRGVKDGVALNLGEIKTVKATSCLIEYEFHDNLTEAHEIINKLDELATATCKGICKYFGVEYKEPEPPKEDDEKAPDGKLFKVQVGAFSFKSGAEKLKSELEAKGFKCFIKLE